MHAPEVFSSVSQVEDEFPTNHAILSFSKYSVSKTSNTRPTNVLNFREADWGYITYYSQQTILLTECIAKTARLSGEEAWDNWSGVLHEAVNECIPGVKVKQNSGPPLFNGQVKHLTQSRQPGIKLRKLISLKTGHYLGSLETGFRLALLKRSFTGYTQPLAEPVSTNSKRFCHFFKLKTKKSLNSSDR